MADADPAQSADSEPFRTWIGSATPDRITVGGRDLPSEVMGRLTLTELAYLLVTRRNRPPASVASSTRSSCRWPTTASRPARWRFHLYRRTRRSRARSSPLLGRQRSSRSGRRHGVLPRRRADGPGNKATDERRGVAERRSRSAAAPGSVPGPGHPCTAEDPRHAPIELGRGGRRAGPHPAARARRRRARADDRRSPADQRRGAGGAALSTSASRERAQLRRPDGWAVAHLEEEVEHPIGPLADEVSAVRATTSLWSLTWRCATTSPRRSLDYPTRSSPDGGTRRLGLPGRDCPVP